MAIICYNPTQREIANLISDGGWEADEKDTQKRRMLVVRNKNSNVYYVDGFHNCLGFELKNEKGESDEENIWYSLNPDYHDFHCVPNENIITAEGEKLYNVVKKTLTQIKNSIDIPGIIVCYSSGKASAKYHCTYNHQWIVASTCKEKCNICPSSKKDCTIYEYLLSFNRLTCEGEKSPYHIHNYFGQVQFMRYLKKAWTVNHVITGEKTTICQGRGKGNEKDVYDFKMMYPLSGKDGEGRFDPDSGHLSYNAPFTINDCPQAIAKAFAEFIDLCEIMEEKKKTP